jgi:hypothetical protein
MLLSIKFANKIHLKGIAKGRFPRRPFFIWRKPNTNYRKEFQNKKR